MCLLSTTDFTKPVVIFYSICCTRQQKIQSSWWCQEQSTARNQKTKCLSKMPTCATPVATMNSFCVVDPTGGNRRQWQVKVCCSSVPASDMRVMFWDSQIEWTLIILLLKYIVVQDRISALHGVLQINVASMTRNKRQLEQWKVWVNRF